MKASPNSKCIRRVESFLGSHGEGFEEHRDDKMDLNHTIKTFIGSDKTILCFETHQTFFELSFLPLCEASGESDFTLH